MMISLLNIVLPFKNCSSVTNRFFYAFELKFCFGCSETCRVTVGKHFLELHRPFGDIRQINGHSTEAHGSSHLKGTGLFL